MKIEIEASEFYKLQTTAQKLEEQLSTANQELGILKTHMSDKWQKELIQEWVNRSVQEMLLSVLVELGYTEDGNSIHLSSSVSFDEYPKYPAENIHGVINPGKIKVHYGATITNTIRAAFIRIGINPGK